MANIIILGVKVPFTKGGQEVLVSSLMHELKKRGHEVDLVELPFSVFPKESILNQAAMWRSLDLSEFAGKKVDLVIATKFPSYYAKHPKKSLWLVHQRREIYELYGSRFSDFSDDPRDESLRRMLVEGDNKVISECSYVSGISQNVVDRLANYNNIQGTALYPPLPLAGQYKCEEPQNYILSVGRICTIKRVDLILKAMPIVHNFVKLKIAGLADEPGIMDYLKNEIDKHHLWDRVEFLGRVSNEELIDLYAKSLAVYYAPFDEDYGYVTLEAMASGKPVITATDSGGVLEFIKDQECGIIVEPDIDSIGHGINKIVENKELAKQMGQRGIEKINSMSSELQSWDKVVDGLLSPLK